MNRFTHPGSVRRRAAASVGVVALLVSALLIAVLFGLAANLQRPHAVSSSDATTLVLRCAAGLQPPVARVLEQYREENPSVRIEVDYQGSGTLLEAIRIEASQGQSRSDLYLAADSSYMQRGRDDGLLAEVIPIATQHPVIAVKKGNPKQIKGLSDLLREDVAVAIADPEGAAIGRATKLIAEQHGLWKELSESRKMMVAKIPELVNALTIGDAIDAALIWDATVDQIDAIDRVSFPGAEVGASEISIGVVAHCQQPQPTLRLARYLASRDRGQPHFQDAHYRVVEADVWQDHPTVRLFAGSMFQSGVEQTIRDFEQREGVTVDRIYNGCGILVAQMKAGGAPEAYLSCDTKYMDMVSDLFRPSTVLSENDMVIAVRKGNPLGIATLADLAVDGRRVGVCKPKDSALGTLTWELLQELGLEQIYDDPTLTVATGPQLMNALSAGESGGLDAAIVYRSNVLSNSETLERVQIVEMPSETRPSSVATQPWAIAKNTENSRLLGRLYEALVSESSRERFQSAGFRWKMDVFDIE